MKLLCPICGKELEKVEKSCRCGGGHSFDIARQGYVNLLPVQQKHSLHPGDTKQQVQSRRSFGRGLLSAHRPGPLRPGSGVRLRRPDPGCGLR